VTHQANIVFATWFTYDDFGRPIWYVMSRAEGGAIRNDFEGEIYLTAGPAFGTAFDPSRVTRTGVGRGRFVIYNRDVAQIYATVAGRSVSKTLSRFVYAIPPPLCDQKGPPYASVNYQDLWWNPAESGWGFNIAHQGDTLFVTWFGYGANMNPTWLVGSDVRKTGTASFSGVLYRTSGPSISAEPWDPSRVTRTPVGSVSVAFSDDSNAVLTMTVDGVTQVKSITREVYANPPTRCHS
jgi:hypothetical protein